MRNLKYSLIRFVPDLERMEPTNVGIILQGHGRTNFKLNPHTAKRKDVDTQLFQQWRNFFEEEIRGEDIPLFQPRKDSPVFLEYLAGLCGDTVSLTPPLSLQSRDDEDFDLILNSLFDRLVAPIEQSRRATTERATTLFRTLEEEKSLQRRGMRKRPYITLPNQRHWNAYRQVLNGEEIVIDKIEVGNQLGLTADEIQKLAGGVEQIGAYLEMTQVRPRRYVLIADELVEKFADQSDEDFGVMGEELDRVVRSITDSGGHVVRKPQQVRDLVLEIESKLEPPTTISS